MATLELTTGGVFPTENIKQRDKKESIEPKEFIWDQFLKYLSGVILSLSVLNFSVEFLRGIGGSGNGVSCFLPSTVGNDGSIYELNPLQGRYVNDYCACARSVPLTEFFPIFVVINGALLVIPHYVWSSLFKADFDSFFAIVEKLDRLRDFDTGEFDQKNFDRVRKLEIEYGGKGKQPWIFITYIVKLGIQLIITITLMIVSKPIFNDFSVIFDCPQEFLPTIKIPSNTTVPCVYVSLKLLGHIQIAMYIFNGVAILLILIGFVWCFMRHTKELGTRDVAKFVFTSCLTAELFSYPRLDSVVKYRQIFHPRIKKDLDFLLMRLYQADSSHGCDFRSIQIEKELSVLRGNDRMLIHCVMHIQQNPMNEAAQEAAHGQERTLAGVQRHGNVVLKDRLGLEKQHLEEMHVTGIRDKIFEFSFIQFIPNMTPILKYPVAISIGFGTSNFSFALARSFHEVVTVNFHQFCRKTNVHKFLDKYITVNFPDTIFTQHLDEHAKDLKAFFRTKMRSKADLILVGPIEDAAKVLTANLLIDTLYTTQKITPRAILVTIRPLSVGNKSLLDRFRTYKPSVMHFEKARVQQTLSESDRISLEPCSDISCIFEILPYRFKGTYPD